MLLVSITSEKITLIELAGLIMVAPSEGEVEDTVGATVSIVKEVRVIVFPAFPELSVTFIVQSLL